MAEPSPKQQPTHPPPAAPPKPPSLSPQPRTVRPPDPEPNPLKNQPPPAPELPKRRPGRPPKATPTQAPQTPGPSSPAPLDGTGKRPLPLEPAARDAALESVRGEALMALEMLNAAAVAFPPGRPLSADERGAIQPSLEATIYVYGANVDPAVSLALVLGMIGLGRWREYKLTKERPAMPPPAKAAEPPPTPPAPAPAPPPPTAEPPPPVTSPAVGGELVRVEGLPP